MKLLDQIKDFARGAAIIKDWLGGDGIVVHPQTAQKRADICLACPKNVQGLVLTETVAKAISEQLEIKNHLRLRVKGEKSLHHCEVCSCVNRLQIWCPSHFLTKYSTPAELEKYPEACWKRHPEP